MTPAEKSSSDSPDEQNSEPCQGWLFQFGKFVNYLDSCNFEMDKSSLQSFSNIPESQKTHFEMRNSTSSMFFDFQSRDLPDWNGDFKLAEKEKVTGM